MKKAFSLILSLVIMASAMTGIDFSAYAKTNYYYDMNFAKSNIEDLKDYIYRYGSNDSAGNPYIYSIYPANTQDYIYKISYIYNSDMLKFDACFEDENYVSLYYTYYNLNPDVQMSLASGEAGTSVTFDCTEYCYQDLVFDVEYSYGNISYSDIQKWSNLNLQAAIEGWDNCLSCNTPYRLYSIGFNSLCNHKFASTYEMATFNQDGLKVDYCQRCGYNTETDYAGIGKISLSKTKFTYDGKVKTPAITVKDNNGKTIASSNYSVKYQSGRKSPGKYSVKITFINGKYKGTKTLYFTIVPKSTTLSKVTAGKKKFTVKWKKQTKQVTGYQIQYATNSKFTKNKKTITINKNKTTSKTVSKLKAKKKYYVRVRTYKTVKINGKSTKIYSAWSKAKTVTTKK